MGDKSIKKREKKKPKTEKKTIAPLSSVVIVDKSKQST